jgi:hypothetical protein
LADVEEVERNEPLYEWVRQQLVPAEGIERPSARVIPFIPAERRANVDVVLLRLRERKLATPIVVRVEDAGADGVIISSDVLNVWGAGENRYHAIEDFAQTLIGVFETYANTPEAQLSRDAARYLETLRQYFGLL